jgi:hypothetical protein
MPAYGIRLNDALRKAVLHRGQPLRSIAPIAGVGALSAALHGDVA